MRPSRSIGRSRSDSPGIRDGAEEQENGQIAPYDGSELDITTEIVRNETNRKTQELHLVGSHFNGRLESMLGLYYQHLEAWTRRSRWWFWEFAIPNTGPNPGTPGPPGVDGRPLLNPAAVDYVRPGVRRSAIPRWRATLRSPSVTADRLSFNEEPTARSSANSRSGLPTGSISRSGSGSRGRRRDTEYAPAEAFRPVEPGGVPAGDPTRVRRSSAKDRPDSGTASTPKVAMSYEITDDIYLYASTPRGSPLRGRQHPVSAHRARPRDRPHKGDRSAVRLARQPFAAQRDVLRLALGRGARAEVDPGSEQPGVLAPNIPSSDGVAASGLEAEFSYVPGSVGSSNSRSACSIRSILISVIRRRTARGCSPGRRFRTHPRRATRSACVTACRSPEAELLFAGDYGWMDEYERPPRARSVENPDGSNKPEPAYGLLNARIVYQPANRAWQVALFGTNLTNEWYVNGGFDAGDIRVRLGHDRPAARDRRERGARRRLSVPLNPPVKRRGARLCCSRLVANEWEAWQR